jgi:hypothetical protein
VNDVNGKGYGRKRSWPNFKILYWQLPAGTEENHEKPQLGQPVAGAENLTRDLPNMK